MLTAMLSRLATGMIAATLGLACGHPAPAPKLPAAGDNRDDGSGLLAKASVQILTSTDEGGYEPEPVNRGYGYGYGYGYDYGYGGGYTYGGFGGDWYGGGGYGGNIYASFQPYMPYNQVQRIPDYTITSATELGAIEGQVTWPKPPRAPETIDGPSGCGQVANPSLRLGSGNAVEGAVVYLEKITQGRSMMGANQYTGYRPITTGGAVELRDCALTPRVQVQLPVPGQLTLSNAHDVPVTLVAERPGDAGGARLEQRLDVGASRAIAMQSTGVTRIADQTGALSPAWIVAGNHPYYTLTDDRGRFRLDEVVPGDYTLIAWHPPVVTAIVDGKAVYGEPVIVSKKITVKKIASTTVAFALP
jgi:hypothetical protein